MLWGHGKAEILFEGISACSRSYKKTEEQHKVVALNYSFTLSILHLTLHLLSGAPFHFHFFLWLICLTLALFNGLVKLNPPKTG